MFLERNKRGRLQQVRSPKEKEKFGRLKPTGTILDPPIWIDPGESPLPLSKKFFDPGKGKFHSLPKDTNLPDRSREPPPNNTRQKDRSRRPRISNATRRWVDTVSAADRYLPHEDPQEYPPDQEPEFRPPAADPPRGTRRSRDPPAPDPPRGARRPVRPPSPDPPRGARRQANPPAPDPGDYPLDREPEVPPPAPNPPRGTRRPARPPGPDIAAYRGLPQRFDAKRVIIRIPEELFEESSRDISLNTGTKYPCTQKDLDACGGNSRRTSRKQDQVQLRAMWFSQPNSRASVSVKTAATEIFDHNKPERRKRIPSGKEQEAINRLLTMLENACRDSWGPDLAIKVFCDLDTVFFRGKLRGHVCITWADLGEFPDRNVFGHTIFLGRGKAVIQLNAQFMFFDWGRTDGRLLNQTLATVLHEMVHAYQFVNCPEHGKDGWIAIHSSKSGCHDKNFGTMMLAVNARAFELLGLKGDPRRYPCYEYAKSENSP